MANPNETLILNEGIYSVRGMWLSNMSILTTRSFIIKNKDNPDILIIDTCGPGSGKIIFDSVKNCGLNPSDITGVAITHWHKDHTGGLAELISLVAAAGGRLVKIFMHESDADVFMKQRGEFIKFHPLLKLPVFHKPGRMPEKNKCEFVKLTDAIEQNPLDSMDMDFIPTPGHTSGHTSFFHRSSMSLFSGCALSLFGRSTVGLVPVFYNREMQVKSAHKLMEMEFRFLYPAHMNIRTDEITLERRVPFKGAIPRIDHITGTLPLFRYSSN